MAIDVTCPSCGLEFTLSDQLKGMKVRCKNCETSFVVGSKSKARSKSEDAQEDGVQLDDPRSRRRPVKDDSAPPRKRPRDEDDSEPPRKNLPKKPQKEPIWLMVGGVTLVVVVLLLCAGFPLYYFVFRKPAVSSEPVAQRTSTAPAHPQATTSQVFNHPVNPPITDFPINPMLGPPPQPNRSPAEQTVTIRLLGMPDARTRKDILTKIDTLRDPGGPSFTRTITSAGRITIMVSPVADPHAFAARIDFGKVEQVLGRTITVNLGQGSGEKMVVSPPGPLPSPVPSDFEPPGASLNRSLTEMRTGNSAVRKAGADRLLTIKPNERRAEVARALEGLLNDPDLSVRQAAMKTLSRWADKDSVPALIKVLGDQDPLVRAPAIEALGQLQDERAAEPLAQLLPSLFDRAKASQALQSMGPVAEKAVLKQLNHADPQVRTEACNILKVIGTKESLKPLTTRVTRDQSPNVASAARDALLLIRSRP